MPGVCLSCCLGIYSLNTVLNDTIKNNKNFQNKGAIAFYTKLYFKTSNRQSSILNTKYIIVTMHL